VTSWLFALALACSTASAQPLALPAPPRARLEQHAGAHVPLDVQVVDEQGRRRSLANYVDGSRPVLLVPGYYRCAQLCGLVMHSLLDALRDSGVAAGGLRIVAIGIDPRETPADARARRRLDMDYAATRGIAPDLHLLTLPANDLARLTSVIGVRSEAVPSDGTIAHPATVVLVTPGGDISRYFNGVGLDPGEMRVALADASGDRIGGLASRVALLCAHFDPKVGRFDNAVMEATRIVGVLLVAALVAWGWRHRKEKGH
jgi:protein SCO1/2